jgi:hypothetical protein
LGWINLLAVSINITINITIPITKPNNGGYTTDAAQPRYPHPI